MNTNTLPTKNNLMHLQEKIKLSYEGQELLEKKKFILTIEKNKYIKKQRELESQLSTLFKDAYLKFKNASVDVGIDKLINISQEIPFETSINIKYKTIMGVEIPSVIFEKKDLNLNYGLLKTTLSVDETIIAFTKIKNLLIELSEIENTIFRLNINILKVQKRSNALKDIIIPQDEKDLNNIKNTLEEHEREEFSRLKIVKKKAENGG